MLTSYRYNNRVARRAIHRRGGNHQNYDAVNWVDWAEERMISYWYEAGAIAMAVAGGRAEVNDGDE